ncbi:unnamed protein product [Caenorhabditis angaria]|uniref:G-protein coupled receptors family 1 profile domain-containing protein n=1 Tax=Caenorhabditis angaria TaxID=860376 RepID=A0A9P1N8P1_9PELO|nr:unnamed protein product [Caenorhabditis angaria]
MVQKELIESLIAIFMSIGVFGNLNVIIAIGRKKILRTKGAMFVLFLAIAHLFCNISELIGLVLHYRFTPMSRRKCFQYNILYTFFVLFQSSLFLMMAFDLCFSIVLPLKHMLWKKSRYVLVMLIFPVAFSIFCILLSMVNLSDEIAPYCIFMLAPDPLVYRSISSLNVFCNVSTLIIIIGSIFVALKKSKNMRGSRHSNSSKTGSLKEEKNKVFRSTFFMCVIYMGSWMLATCMFKVLISIKDEQAAVELLSYVVVVVLPNYCQTYFVAYLRSPRFRKAFQEQLNWMTCGIMFSKVFDKTKNRSIQALNNNQNQNQHSRSLPERQSSVKFSENTKMPK